MLATPALVAGDERAQIGANCGGRVLPDQRMAGDSTALEVGEAFERDLFDQLVVGAGVGIQSVEATRRAQLLEETLEDPMHERAALQWIDGPAVFGSVGGIDAQDAAKEELEWAGGPRLDSGC